MENKERQFIIKDKEWLAKFCPECGRRNALRRSPDDDEDIIICSDCPHQYVFNIECYPPMDIEKALVKDNMKDGENDA